MSGGGRRLVTLSVLVMTLAAAGCGSSSSSSTTSSAAGSAGATTASQTTGTATSSASVGHLPTAKFVLHAGLAFGAFHRYIYKPFKAGQLHGFTHKLALLKAGVAGLFAYHELKLAVLDAHASPILSKLLAPVDALGNKLKGIGSSAKGGSIDGSSIESANGDITSLSGQAKQSGLSIPANSPSAGQLASGG